MKRLLSVAVCVVAVASIAVSQSKPDWSQWARTSQHNGATSAVGQSPSKKIASMTYDPFTMQEQAETFGDLLSHYQSPLIDHNLIFQEVKTGTYVSCQPPGSGQPFPCGPDAWNQQIWNERAFILQGGQLVQQWNFQSDWKPEPSGNGLFGWEPVFHAALANGFVFVPGFGGSVYKLNKSDGTQVAHYQPLGPTDDPNTYVSGPLTTDPKGNVYWNVIAMNASNPWGSNIRGAWLVRASPQGTIRKVSYTTLVPDAPTTCGGQSCGSQRPGINISPALSADGKTIYTVSRTHFFSDFSFLVAVNSDLTPQWDRSLRNRVGAGIIAYDSDISSSTPAVAPDGSILYGAVGTNGSRGYMLKFDPTGQYLASYDFGWDETPAIYAHDGTYSVIIKDNHYDSGGPYYITRLSANLTKEWSFRSPTNFEWCVNAPAVDANGTVYANSEDGNVYVINPDGTLKGNIFLRRAVGAAYTPIAIGRDGTIYTENAGDMFLVGN